MSRSSGGVSTSPTPTPALSSSRESDQEEFRRICGSLPPETAPEKLVCMSDGGPEDQLSPSELAEMLIRIPTAEPPRD
jgi:hypothetical protein